MSGVTIHGLNEWYKHEFEHLGWMVLAHSRGSNGDAHCQKKVELYIESIEKLYEHLKLKCAEVESKDIKNDLTILKEDIGLLYRFVTKNWKEGEKTLAGGGKKKSSKKSSKRK